MKSWQPTLLAHVASWTQRHPLNWVPKFVYHFTHVCNAARILSAGRLLSRAEASRQESMVTDNASQTIISQTDPGNIEYVRLYFRPKTPTQYHNEGIRRPVDRFQDAHCPVPVFLLFELVGVISIDDVRCSDGNMASHHVQHSDTEAFFQSIPFEKVYHSGPLTADEKASVIFHRHAEVLVPGELALEPHLKGVVCRTVPEKQTLLSLLPDRDRKKWEPRISTASTGLFYGHHAYVESVSVMGDAIEFRFRLRYGVPYRMRAAVLDDDGREREWHSDDWNSARLKLRLPDPPASATVAFFIEECLAFRGRVVFDSIPF